MRALVQVCIFCLFAFASGCGTGPEATALSFSGKITGTNEIAVTKVVDLNRGKVQLFGRIAVDADGSFNQPFENVEPHLYELNFPNGKKVQFVTDGATALEFEGSAANPEEIRIIGSEANELFQKYERFRKESLERLVKSVRKKIKEFPDKSSAEFEKLGKMETVNYVKHKQELLDF
ncbi:MAG: flagellar brake protein, partial [Acidobacteriota bacterium]|nr:flagellar brake protein [Acidobacteriota bacterium]